MAQSEHSYSIKKKNGRISRNDEAIRPKSKSQQVSEILVSELLTASRGLHRLEVQSAFLSFLLMADVTFLMPISPASRSFLPQISHISCISNILIPPLQFGIFLSSFTEYLIITPMPPNTTVKWRQAMCDRHLTATNKNSKKNRNLKQYLFLAPIQGTRVHLYQSKFSCLNCKC